MIKTKAPAGCILTYSGRFVNPLKATVDDIRLVDIAHGTSNLCRYNGHVDQFYSVAQHSVIVSQQFDDEYLRRWGLFHDASEAYLGDVVAPLKYSGHYDFYLEAEERLMDIICDKFGLNHTMPPEIDFTDKKLRANEMRDLKSYTPEEFPDYYDITINPWMPTRAKYEFIWEAEELGVYV